MTPQELLQLAAAWVEQPRDATGALWARAATILTRQALEEHVARVLGASAPGSKAATFDAQLVLLCDVLPDRALARRVRYTWCALSSASHHQSYELPPTATELADWMATVQAFLSS